MLKVIILIFSPLTGDHFSPLHRPFPMLAQLSVYSNHIKKAGHIKRRTANPPILLSCFSPANFCLFGLKTTHAVTEMEGRWKSAWAWRKGDKIGLLLMVAATHAALKLLTWHETVGWWCSIRKLPFSVRSVWRWRLLLCLDVEFLLKSYLNSCFSM